MREWAAKPKHPFAEQYVLARIRGFDLLFDEPLDIADDNSKDWIERGGRWVVNGEVIDRAKLRIDARKWLLSKMLRKTFGGSAASKS